jgi:hypothetical protein
VPDESSYTLRALRSDDRRVVRALWSARFGGDPATQTKWLDAALDPDHSAVGLVAVGSDSSERLGFSLLEVGDRSYAREYFRCATLELEIPIADRTGIFHLSCVRAS